MTSKPRKQINAILQLDLNPQPLSSKTNTQPRSKEFLDIQPTIECGIPLKRGRDMIRT